MTDDEREQFKSVRTPKGRVEELRVAGICAYVTSRLANCGFLAGAQDWPEAKRFLATVPDDLFAMNVNLPPMRLHQHPDQLALQSAPRPAESTRHD